MINEYLTRLISSREILISIGFSLIILLTLCYYLFKDRSSDLVGKFFMGILATLTIDLIVLFVAYFLVFYILKNINTPFLIVSVLFFLFYFINLIIKIIVDTRNALFKGKKIGSLKEALGIVRNENISRVITLVVFLLIFLLSIVAVGNGRINTLVVLLLISGVVSSFSSIYILPLFLKISDKVIK